LRTRAAAALLGPDVPTPNRRTILLIDDDFLQQKLVGQIVKSFKRLGCDLHVASEYDDGLKKLLTGQYVACLLDYRLGYRDGLELLRTARAQGDNTPVIFLTAEADDQTDLAAMEAGAMDYLVKGDMTPRTLERSIRYAIKLAETMDQLRRLATRDELTGLLNRREFQRIIKEEAARALQNGKPFSLVLLDIDHFKQINDTHGHPAGDAVLQHVASLLSAQVRDVDRVARYGGEEFAVFMANTNLEHAAEAAERLRAMLSSMDFEVEGKIIAPTFSAGVAALPDNARNAGELLQAADGALYTSKRLGRNRVTTAGLPGATGR
jgi:diguanylate cyclase (GGDEF)-like protein